MTNLLVLLLRPRLRRVTYVGGPFWVVGESAVPIIKIEKIPFHVWGLHVAGRSNYVPRLWGAIND